MINDKCHVFGANAEPRALEIHENEQSFFTPFLSLPVFVDAFFLFNAKSRSRKDAKDFEKLILKAATRRHFQRRPGS
jgi:hypothetical protein